MKTKEHRPHLVMKEEYLIDCFFIDIFTLLRTRSTSQGTVFNVQYNKRRKTSMILPLCVCVCIYQTAHNRAIHHYHPRHLLPAGNT